MQEFIKCLSLSGLDHSIVHKRIQRVVTEYDSSDELRISSALLSLREALMVGYEAPINHLLRQNAKKAIAFVIELRRDIKLWKSSQVVNSNEVLRGELTRLDLFLRDTLSTWFSPSLLEARRITYDTTPASVIETIAKKEAVHPMKNLDDLRDRLGPDRRVYAVFHRLMPEKPLTVLHSSLQSSVPSRMEQVLASNSLDENPSVAAFYSISSVQFGLHGVGLGEFLIKEAVKKLSNSVGIETFVTLSPLPGFRTWLESEQDEVRETIIPQRKIKDLSVSLRCQPCEAVNTMLRVMDEHGPESFDQHLELFQPVLSYLVAHYLLDVKIGSRPVDPVCQFHIGNGAILERINLLADTTPRGWRKSYGVMVNYYYDLEKVPERREQYAIDYTIPYSDQVQTWTTSKNET